jgi:hypothetical protein
MTKKKEKKVVKAKVEKQAIVEINMDTSTQTVFVKPKINYLRQAGVK